MGTRYRFTRRDYERDMHRCLALARQSRGHAKVGCVIRDRSGALLAEGWHRVPGAPHAEADAIAQLGGDVPPGATLIVNLEPCRHTGRTPPCADAIVRAGIARVVVGMPDPIAGHGGGADWLETRGVEVIRDVLRGPCEHVNRAFSQWATTGLPRVVFKAATTLDGRIATQAGESQWITGKDARARGHAMRAQADGIMVGINTVLADDPRLTVRDREHLRQPRRIVVDSQLRTPLEARVLEDSPAGTTIVACTRSASEARARGLRERGALVVRFGERQVDLDRLCRYLAQKDLVTVLIEGGATLGSSAVDAGLVDEIALFVAPKIVGGDAPHWLRAHGVDRLVDAKRFSIRSTERLGDDVLLLLDRPEK